LKGSGHEGLSEELNAAIYQEATSTIVGAVGGLGLNISDIRILEVGCGSGYWASVFERMGVRSYTGVDVAGVLIPDLMRRYPTFAFYQADITQEPPTSTYDLVLAIDVLEHIVQPQPLESSLKNLAYACGSGYLFIGPVYRRSRRHLFYVRFWSKEEILERLRGFEVVETLPFKSEELLILRRSEGRELSE
jgi:2-polyprenyl-3-methyl-5-hydroxy-6-metoxy-1,4-benzoquinol methylase